MQDHRFDLGDRFLFVPEQMASVACPGLVEVARFLPSDGVEVQYQVEALTGGQERVVRESQLRRP